MVMDLLRTLNGAQVLGMIGILAGALVLLVIVFLSFWSYVRTASIEANLKREMLARGLSAEEIERLTISTHERNARVEADRNMRELQINADMKRELLAKGVSPDVVQQMTGTSSLKVNAEARILADTIINMIHDDEIDKDVLVGLLQAFLHRGNDFRVVAKQNEVKPDELILDRIPSERN